MLSFYYFRLVVLLFDSAGLVCQLSLFLGIFNKKSTKPFERDWKVTGVVGRLVTAHQLRQGQSFMSTCLLRLHHRTTEASAN